MALAAAIMMSSAAMAQTKDSVKVRKFDKTEMAKKRTAMTVKRYGLNSEQAAKLLELNTQYADSMNMGMAHPGARNMQRFARTNDRRMATAKRDSMTKVPMKKAEGSMKKMEGSMRMVKGQPVKSRDFRSNAAKVMESYNAKLKEIMTEEQYKKYTEDMQNRMNRQAKPRVAPVRRQKTDNVK